MDSYHYAETPAPAGAPLLIVLHGTGGNETSLLELGQKLMPGAHIVSPRGDVSENGMPRYFRRLERGVYDMADLERATAKLAAFIGERAAEMRPASVAALGYSNGANILASVLFAAPELIGRAVLMHPLIPFTPPPQPGLAGKPILLTAGRRDPIAPASASEFLNTYFLRQDALSQVAWHSGGHEIQASELSAAAEFLAVSATA
jgi:phospholipase/carboxylesterase